MLVLAEGLSLLFVAFRACAPNWAIPAASSPAKRKHSVLVIGFVLRVQAPWLCVIVAFCRRSIAISMGVLALCMIVAPLSPLLAIAVAVYGLMGSGRGVSGVAINTSLMEQVPQHFMGRVQNTFYFGGTMLQIILALTVGAVAQYNLVAGFSLIGLVYAGAFVSASWPVAGTTAVQEASPAE